MSLRDYTLLLTSVDEQWHIQSHVNVSMATNGLTYKGSCSASAFFHALHTSPTALFILGRSKAMIQTFDSLDPSNLILVIVSRISLSIGKAGSAQKDTWLVQHTDASNARWSGLRRKIMHA